MRRTLGWILGHLINADHVLGADVLQEFSAWSAEVGAILPEAPCEPES